MSEAKGDNQQDQRCAPSRGCWSRGCGPWSSVRLIPVKLFTISHLPRDRSTAGTSKSRPQPMSQPAPQMTDGLLIEHHFNSEKPASKQQEEKNRTVGAEFPTNIGPAPWLASHGQGLSRPPPVEHHPQSEPSPVCHPCKIPKSVSSPPSQQPNIPPFPYHNRHPPPPRPPQSSPHRQSVDPLESPPFHLRDLLLDPPEDEGAPESALHASQHTW